MITDIETVADAIADSRDHEAVRTILEGWVTNGCPHLRTGGAAGSIGKECWEAVVQYAETDHQDLLVQIVTA